MTRVAYLNRNVAGAMEDVAEDQSQSFPLTSLPWSPGIRC